MCSSAASSIGADVSRGEMSEGNPDVEAEVVTLPTVALVFPRRLITEGNLTRVTTVFCVELLLPIFAEGRDILAPVRIHSSANSRDSEWSCAIAGWQWKGMVVARQEQGAVRSVMRWAWTDR